jgi:hypothetical protein
MNGPPSRNSIGDYWNPPGRRAAHFRQTGRRLRSYAVCVTNLARNLRFSLQNEVVGAHLRQEFGVRDAMLPQGAKFPLLGQAWLKNLLEDREPGPTGQ